MTGQTHLDVTTSTNGHQAPAPGNLGFNQIQLHRIDKHQADVKELNNGALVATVHEQLSKDGNTLTSTTTSAGHPPQITVWTRSAGAKNPKDPFAGTWTEDLSKSEMREGDSLKIEAEANGAVHFVGGYSYTAHLDGKPYPLQDSRNDTVALQLVDPHTVEAISRRDNQITQKDRWQVSPDGHQMTLSSTAVLETGQHETEQLVFRKQ
jgi:hypothetical protein